MSEDELDYMSDAFLSEAVNSDVRPGLLKSWKEKRDLQNWKKKGKKERLTPTVSLEHETRTQGLKKPIANDNKGFAMLTKMGFNPGAGLGRHGQGCTEPIGIDVKSDKQGLGRKTAVLEVLERKRKMLQERKDKVLSVENFRATFSEKAYERQTREYLSKSQRVCYTMDQERGVEKPDEDFFWPRFTQEPADDADTEQESLEQTDIELSDKEKLELLTMYLRRTHYYCVWCGVKYENDDDFRDCPGSSRIDHF